MAKLSIQAGAQSQSVNVFIQDSSSTVGAGLTGLVFNSSGLTAYYTFAGANATATSITLATLAAVTSAYSSGGFKEIDATNMPGVYRFDIPNAALATSKGRSVVILFKGATNMAPLPLEIELTGWDNQDAVRGGLTAFPNVASGSAGALLVDGTGTAAIANSSGKVLLQATQTGVTIPTVTNLTNAPSAGDFTSTMKASITAAVPTATTIAGDVWDVTLSGHLTSGSTGAALNAAGAAGDPWSTAIPGAYGAGTAGNIVGNNLDAAVTSRMASYAQPTGFLAATFPTTVASPTNITAATGITVATNNDKTGYSLTQSFPANFASLAIDSTGRVNAFLIGILTSVFTEGATGRIAAAFKQFFNIASPAATMDHGILVDTVTTATTATNLTTNNDKTGYALTAAYDAAKTAAQAGDAMTVDVGGIQATSFAAGAIDASAIATDAIGSAEVAATAVTKIAAGVGAVNCTEPTTVPSASPTLIAALSWLLTLSRNKITQTSTTQTLKADDGSTTVASSSVSDDGTTFTRGEFS